MLHFGVEVREGKNGLKVSRDNYAIINKRNSLGKFEILAKLNAYEDETGKFYTDDWCNSYREQCLLNFDLNMKFFSSLAHSEFEKNLQKFLRIYKKAKRVSDLNDLDNVEGCYILVLDEFCQAYIGQSTNIKKRIRQHWVEVKPFDRLLFPMGAVKTSVLSVDSFRALDTTRIYVYETSKGFEMEEKMVKKIHPDFLLNRIAGGKPMDGLLGVMQMKPTIKVRKLQDENQ